MNLPKIVLLVSSIAFGVSNAATAPCNGFKINLENKAHEQLIVDGVSLTNGTINSVDPQLIEVNKKATYTINSTIEGNVMAGEFFVHSLTEPSKQVRIHFNLTNKDMVCEVNNKSQAGTLKTGFHRVLGGLNLPVSE